MLVISGYDVWMINIRGHHYSKKHLTLSPDDSEFWNFSHHESALLDYPATIDYIRQTTGQPSMFFVGYSMGTTQYLILLAEKPEYNQAIRAGIKIELNFGPRCGLKIGSVKILFHNLFLFGPVGPTIKLM